MEGLLSEGFASGEDVGSMKDCAFCTRLLRLNIAILCHAVILDTTVVRLQSNGENRSDGKALKDVKNF